MVVRYLLLAIALVVSVALCPPDLHAQSGADSSIEQAVVKIFKVSSGFNHHTPWIRDNHHRSMGSGVMIEGNRILTNAHVVANDTFLQVQPYGSPKRYEASVEFVSHESDLALLRVKDEGIFNGVTPLEMGPMPEARSEVFVYGYPTGGESLSITRGILSRYDYHRYVHSGYYFIAGQIDAALNPGNSGGPVISDGKIVGIAMQVNRSGGAESLGYMIPPPIVGHFLTDIEDGSYDGFPEVGISFQTLESPSLKQKYGLDDASTGVLISHVFYNAEAKGLLREGDVILEIEGHDIADDGSVEIRPNERMSFSHFLDIRQVGDELNLRIAREGEVRDVTLTLVNSGRDFDYIRLRTHDEPPEYLIFGGLVFTPLSHNLLCRWDNCNAPQVLMNERRKFPTESRNEAVVLVQVLPHEVNKGYHGLAPWVPSNLNGVPIRSFSDLYERLTGSSDKFITFSDDYGYKVVIDRSLAEESHEELLELYNVGNDSYIVLPDAQ